MTILSSATPATTYSITDTARINLHKATITEIIFTTGLQNIPTNAFKDFTVLTSVKYQGTTAPTTCDTTSFPASITNIVVPIGYPQNTQFCGKSVTGNELT